MPLLIPSTVSIRQHLHRPAVVGTTRVALSRALLFAGLLTSFGSPVIAGNLFDGTATTYNNTLDLNPQTMASATEHVSSFGVLLNDVGNTTGMFDGFKPGPGLNGKDSFFTGQIDYAGVGAAFKFNVSLYADPSKTADKFTIYSGDGKLLVSRSEFGTTANEAQKALKKDLLAYFKQNGTSVTSALPSKVAPTDGNPNASTANAANATFNAFGTGGPDHTNINALDFSSFEPIKVDISQFESGGFSGYRITAPLGFTYHIPPPVLDGRVGLQLIGVFSYIHVEDVNIYEGGLFLGFPVQIIRPHHLAQTAMHDDKDDKDGKATTSSAGDSKLTWTVTPNGGAVASGSRQFIQGGITYVGGLTSALSYALTDKLILTLGDSFTVAEGSTLDIGDYKFTDDTDQVIFKNGFNLSYELNDRVALQGEALATDFLNSAAIPAYASFALQAVVNKPLGHTTLFGSIGFVTDQAPEYHSYGGRVSLGLSF